MILPAFLIPSSSAVVFFLLLWFGVSDLFGMDQISSNVESFNHKDIPNSYLKHFVFYSWMNSHENGICCWYSQCHDRSIRIKMAFHAKTFYCWLNRMWVVRQLNEKALCACFNWIMSYIDLKIQRKYTESLFCSFPIGVQIENLQSMNVFGIRLLTSLAWFVFQRIAYSVHLIALNRSYFMWHV